MRIKAVPVEFKWRHYEPEIIFVLCEMVSRYALSYRDLMEMMQE